jgi:cytochrome bd-type quinol oxidase subunit 2
MNKETKSWFVLAAILGLLVLVTIVIVNQMVTVKHPETNRKIRNRSYQLMLIGTVGTVAISALFLYFWYMHGRKTSLMNLAAFAFAFFSVYFTIVFNSIEVSKLRELCGKGDSIP